MQGQRLHDLSVAPKIDRKSVGCCEKEVGTGPKRVPPFSFHSDARRQRFCQQIRVGAARNRALRDSTHGPCDQQVAYIRQLLLDIVHDGRLYAAVQGNGDRKICKRGLKAPLIAAAEVSTIA